jgi:hypothetical protein
MKIGGAFFEQREINKYLLRNRINFHSIYHVAGMAEGLDILRGGHCVLKWGFTWKFPGNRDATLK